MTESRSEKLMWMQMVPNHCGSLGHWCLERRIQEKDQALQVFAWGNLIPVFQSPPTSLPTVASHLFRKDVYQFFLNLFCIFSQTLQLVRLMRTLSSSSRKKVEEVEPDLLDRHRAKKSAVDSKPMSGSSARWWCEQGAVVLGCMMILRTCFKEDQIPKQLTTADLPATSFTVARLHFGNTILHLLPLNATLQFVSGKVDTQHSNHNHWPDTIHNI